jgi:hypothetical protein
MALELTLGLVVLAAAVLFFRRRRRLKEDRRVDVLIDDIGEAEARPAPFQLPDKEHTMPAVLVLNPDESSRARRRGGERAADGGAEGPPGGFD